VIKARLESLRSLDLSDWHFRIFAHELAKPTPAMNVVVNEAIRPLYSRMCKLLGSMLGLPPEHERTRLCAHSIIGQILFYAFARPVINRLAPEIKMTATQIDLIADHISEFSLAYLRQMRRRPAKNGKKR
jgi:TetR/AcrR family transcriptional regulator, regulator of cefoperazone and chloramphenicol sensitivity